MVLSPRSNRNADHIRFMYHNNYQNYFQLMINQFETMFTSVTYLSMDIYGTFRLHFKIYFEFLSYRSMLKIESKNSSHKRNIYSKEFTIMSNVHEVQSIMPRRKIKQHKYKVHSNDTRYVYDNVFNSFHEVT